MGENFRLLTERSWDFGGGPDPARTSTLARSRPPAATPEGKRASTSPWKLLFCSPSVRMGLSTHRSVMVVAAHNHLSWQTPSPLSQRLGLLAGAQECRRGSHHDSLGTPPHIYLVCFQTAQHIFVTTFFWTIHRMSAPLPRKELIQAISWWCGGQGLACCLGLNGGGQGVGSPGQMLQPRWLPQGAQGGQVQVPQGVVCGVKSGAREVRGNVEGGG